MNNRIFIKGYTLIEITLAMAVMGFALIPIFSMITSSNSATRQQKAEGVAANLAKEEMNRLLSVITKNNLATYEGSETLYKTITIEGNEYQVYIRTQRIRDNELDVTYPQINWHDIRNSCSGAITHTPKKVKLSEVVKNPDASNFHLMDILIRVKWKLPNERNFRDACQLILITRRAFI